MVFWGPNLRPAKVQLFESMRAERGHVAVVDERGMTYHAVGLLGDGSLVRAWWPRGLVRLSSSNEVPWAAESAPGTRMVWYALIGHVSIHVRMFGPNCCKT